MQPLPPLPNATCPLCDAPAEAARADAGNAQFTKCVASDCGHSVVTDTARTHLRHPRRAPYRLKLSRDAAAATARGLVLRVWMERSRNYPARPLQLRYNEITPQSVQGDHSPD